jgi:hypothetical protein
MPLNNPAPQFGLLTAWDMTGQSGVTVFSRSGGSSVSLPTYASGQGLYEDTLFFLNGRGSSSALYGSGQLMTSATFGSVSSWSITINENDKVQITSNVDFEVTLTGSNDALGFGSSTVNASLVGSDYIATALNDWTRGLIDLDDVTYRIDETGGAQTFNFPTIKSDVQDVTTFMRTESQSDSDDFSLSSLQALDNTAQGSTNINWSITDDGYTQCRYETSDGAITWSSSTIRNLLGFTGEESPVVDGTHERLTSTHKNHGVLIPSRPYQSLHLRVNNVGQNRRKIGGGYVSNFIGSYVTSVLTFDLDALLDQVDDYRHFANKLLPLVAPGERINFYQDWGDSRRALITSDIAGTQEAYDLLYTSEDNGSYGRIRGSLTNADYDLAYPSRLRRRVPVSVEIEHL